MYSLDEFSTGATRNTKTLNRYYTFTPLSPLRWIIGSRDTYKGHILVCNKTSLYKHTYICVHLCTYLYIGSQIDTFKWIHLCIEHRIHTSPQIYSQVCRHIRINIAHTHIFKQLNTYEHIRIKGHKERTSIHVCKHRYNYTHMKTSENPTISTHVCTHINMYACVNT